MACGAGKRTATRRVAQSAQHGGKSCTGGSSKKKSCTGTDCGPGKITFKELNLSTPLFMLTKLPAGVCYKKVGW